MLHLREKFSLVGNLSSLDPNEACTFFVSCFPVVT